MRSVTQRRVGITTLCAAASLLATSAANAAGHFDQFVDPTYTTSIYAGPLVGSGSIAWTTSSHMLTRNGSTIIEYSPTNSNVHLGTNVHDPIVNHTVPGLQGTGIGMTNGTDGYIYTVGGAGVQRVDPSNWATPAFTMPTSVGGGQGWAISTMPNGKLVYSDGSGASQVYVYDPATFTNTPIYTAPTLVDDIECGPGGVIALAGQGNSSIIILNSAGGVINQFPTPRYPDGLAFGAGPFANSVYANNNDGSITRFDLGAGWTGAPTIVDIATTQAGHHGYGDVAAVGPDCAFYISTFANVNFGHGNDAGIGTNWDNGTTNGEGSIVRVGAGVDRNGLPITDCVFYSLVETSLPEPASGAVLAMGLLPLLRRARRR